MATYRKTMTDTQKALFIRTNGREGFQKLPYAPFPVELVEEQQLRRSTMSQTQRVQFIRDHGQANFDLLPL